MEARSLPHKWQGPNSWSCPGVRITGGCSGHWASQLTSQPVLAPQCPVSLWTVQRGVYFTQVQFCCDLVWSERYHYETQNENVYFGAKKFVIYTYEGVPLYYKKPHMDFQRTLVVK